MIDKTLSRRALLLGTALGLITAAGPAVAKKRRKAAEKPKAEPAAPITRLPIPPLVDLAGGETYDLVAEPATHAYLADKPVAAIGYGGTYMGPALRLRRGSEARIRLVNRLDRPTNLHWHGLLVPANRDGSTLPAIAPGASWEAALPVDQPAATLWYHAHVHGHAARDVHDGLAGLLIVDDPANADLRLPTAWGIDDLPLVLQDRDFDETGRPVGGDTPATVEFGFRGKTMLVNGVADPVATVPRRLVRLRLLNAAGARTFRLFFEDQRPFHLIATDGGFLAAPAPLSLLVLAPGERAEILVDFAEGSNALLTGPDEHEHRVAGEVKIVPDVLDRPARLLAFEASRNDETGATARPARLAELAPLPKATGDIARRRFELRVRPNPAALAAGHDQTVRSHGSMTNGPIGVDGRGPATPIPAALMTINGKSFVAGRIDEKVKLGATEIWEIVCPDTAHPFHLHGAQFRVLSEDGGEPKLWNRGVKDTVLVENSAELLVTFTRPADAAAPFLYHCHLLAHEDGGMMGAFTVG